MAIAIGSIVTFDLAFLEDGMPQLQQVHVGIVNAVTVTDADVIWVNCEQPSLQLALDLTILREVLVDAAPLFERGVIVRVNGKQVLNDAQVSAQPYGGVVVSALEIGAVKYSLIRDIRGRLTLSKSADITQTDAIV
jgi:hypothetical protein